MRVDAPAEIVVDGEVMTGRIVAFEVDRARGHERREVTLRIETITEAPAGDGRWTLTAEDLSELEHWYAVANGEGYVTGLPDLLDRLRAIVGRPMVAAALAREGWRPRLAMIEAKLTEALTTEDPDATEDRMDEARSEVRAMLDGSSGGAEPWQRKLAELEARLTEVRVYCRDHGLPATAEDVDGIVADMRALIES